MLFILSVLIRCNNTDNTSKSEEELIVENNEKEIEQLNSDLKKYSFEPQDSILKSVYDTNDFKNLWFNENFILSEEAIQLIDLLQKANGFGLNPVHYHLDSLEVYKTAFETNFQNALELEITLSKSYVKFGTHLHRGLIDTPKVYTDLKLKDSLISFSKVMKKGELIKQLLLLQPQHIEYQKLQKALAKYVSENEISDDFIAIPNFKKDSVKSYEAAKLALIKLDYLSSSDTGIQIVEGVKLFQEDNGLTPDGLIGKHTAEMLEYSGSKIYFQAAINLEKWRWIEDWGKDYFFANIPEFLFKVYENNELVINNRTVVGTSYTPTPEIQSQLKYFIVNPEWHVPYSITSGELIPKMKKDPTYLERNGYAISTKGVAINDIDWENANASSFKYTIKQKSGSSNALGKVKFIFDNKHSVYFHDTPSKSFFKKDIRTYSHGCVRLENPFDVANYIVNKEENPKWENLIDTLLVKKTTKTMTPSGIYPIHIAYFSSTGTNNGHLKTMLDVYKKDEALIEAFKNKYFLKD